MKNLSMYFTLSFFLVFNCSKRNDNAEKIRKTVEYSTGILNKRINEIIWEFNVNKVKGVDKQKKMKNLYDETLKIHKIARKMIYDLDDIDSSVDLKKSALIYFDEILNYVDNYIKPIALMSFEELHEADSLHLMFYESNVKMVEETKKFQKSIEEFCNEFGLVKELPYLNEKDFEKQKLEAEKALGI